MRRPFVVLAVVGAGTIAGASAGCGGKRDVCDPGFGIKFAPVADVWKPYQELFPPEATLCGHLAMLGPPNKRALNIDFADEPNPAPKMMAHLESKGFTRATAAMDNPDSQTIKLVRGPDATHAAQTFRATTFRDKGLVRAVVEIEEAACDAALVSAPQGGGSACRDQDLVRCEAGTLMVAEVQKCPNGCEAEGGKARCK